MDPMEEIRETFFQECEELLEELEAGLITLEEGAGDGETVNAMFRAVHSIKGGAGAFGLDDLVRFAHRFETTLDEVRSERLEATEPVVKVFLRASDQLADLVAASRQGDACDTDGANAIISELEALVGEEGAAPEPVAQEPAAEPSEDEADFMPLSLDMDLDLDDDGSADESHGVVIQFKPRRELYQNGNETSRLFRSLEEFGEIEVECDDSTLPGLEQLDPEEAYLSWTVKVATSEDKDEIESVFEFVEEDCDIEISADGESGVIGLDIDDIDMEADEEAVVADADVEESDTRVTVNEAPDGEPGASAEVEQPPADPNVAKEESNEASKPDAEPSKTPARAAPKATVRVDLERVDRLINLVGELVVNQAMLTQSVIEAGVSPNSAAGAELEDLKQLTREIQESVMAIRAQPVKSLFQRMSRIVRETSAIAGKKVQLQLDGEATEVDKTVIERLSDPLTHMIRNAIDHGLESNEKRVETGKPEEGTVRLSAAHRSGRVVIELSDDGGGINRDRVKQIAIDKDLIPADAQLSNTEIDNLLFLPGFSTAKAVSDLSGRGVGMDVVKRAIQSLGGRISINSTPGKGTTFSISLPLTLAVLDGMVVTVAEQVVVVPLTSIVETLKTDPEDVHDLGGGASVVFVRGEFVPITDVGYELGYRARLANYSDSVFLLVEKDDGSRSAVAVDTIKDQRQVVIKGLEDNYGAVPGVAAATILGDGRIALILDTDHLITDSGITPAPQTSNYAMAG